MLSVQYVMPAAASEFRTILVKQQPHHFFVAKKKQPHHFLDELFLNKQ